MGLLTLTVLSLLALMSILESADHVSRYTAPTCPRSVATNLADELGDAVQATDWRTHFPVLPSHSLTLLSQEALAAHFPSGLNATCDICR
jgi:hypothetical protein